MADYHGPKPVTKSDKKMAKTHLKVTKKLVKAKIKDHQQAIQKTSNPKSKAYNQGHISGHQTELNQINRSLKTVSKLHPK